MSGDVIKEYLVGLGFDVDDASVGQVSTVMRNISGAVTSLGTTVAEGVKGLKEYFGTVGDESETVQEGTEAIEAFKDGVDLAADATDDLTEAMKDSADSAHALTDDVTKAAKSTDKMADATKDNAKAMKDGAGAAKDFSAQASKVEDAQKKAEEATKKATSAMDMYKKAVTVVKAAVSAFVATGIVKMMQGIAQSEAELTKTAHALKKTRDEARAYTTALEAMGVTAEDLAGDKKLRATHAELMKIGMAMKLPESSGGLDAINGLANGFLHLKVIASYALKWIYHQIVSVCEGPIKQFRTMFDKLNASFKMHIPSISKGVAEAVNVLLRLAVTVARVFMAVFDLIGRIPNPIKGIGGVLLGLWAVMKAGPFGWIMLAIAGILLLVEDFITYLDGGESLFGDFWGALLGWIEQCKPYIKAVGEWFEKAADTAVGAVKWIIDQVKNIWKTLKDNGAINGFKEYYLTMFRLVGGAISGVINWVKKLFSSANEGNNFKEVFTNIVSIISKLYTWISRTIKKFFEMGSVQTTIQGVADFLKDVLLAAWEAVSGAVEALVKLLNGDVAGAWETLKSTAGAVVEKIDEAVSGLWDTITELFSGIGEWFSEKFKSVVEFIKDPFGSIKEFFTGKKDEATGEFDGIDADIGSKFSGVPGKVGEAVSGMSDFASAAWTTISDSLSTIAGDITSWFGGISLPAASDISDFASSAWTTIKDNFSGAADNISSWFKDINLPTASDISDFASTAWTDIKGNFEDAGSTITEWFGGISVPTASDLSDFATTAWTNIEGRLLDAGTTISGWFGKIDLSSATTGISDWAGEAWSTVTTAFENGGVSEWFTNTFDGVKGAIDEKVTGITDWASDAWGKVTTAFQDGKVSDWFTTTFEGVKGAIDEKVTGITDWAGTAWQGMKDGFEGVGTWFDTTFKGVPGQISGAVSTAKDWAATAWEEMQNGFDGVSTWFDTTFSDVPGQIDKAVEGVSNWASAAWTNMQNGFAGVGTWFTTNFSGISGQIDEAVKGVSDWAGTAWANITSAFGGEGSVNEWFTSTFSGVGETIQGAVGAVTDWASDTWESTKGLVQDTGNWFKNLFGWGDDASAQTEEFVDAAQDQKQKIVAAFSGADSDIAAVFQSMVTLSEPSIELIAMMMKAAYEKAAKEFKPLPTDVKTIFTKLSDSIKTPFERAVSAFVDQVNKMKTALNSIPRNITVSVTTSGVPNPGYSDGGVIDREMDIRAGEQNKREYIIPVTKPQRAIPLIRAAMKDLGMTPSNTKSAMKALGGSATSNALPSYAQTTNNNSSVVQHIDAHSEVKINGATDRAVVREVERTQQNHVRNLKGVFVP